MPRYFPVSQDIFRDPEVWEMCAKYGDRFLFVWLEMLSIADRNGGVLKGTVEAWSEVLNRVYSKDNPRWSRRGSERLQRAIRELSERHWIAIREGSEASLKICNYAKYHKTRSERSLPPNQPNLTKPHSLKKENDEPASPAPSVGLKNEGKNEPEKRGQKSGSEVGKGEALNPPAKGRSMGLSPELKEQSDRLFYSDPTKFKRLALWIQQGRTNGYSEPDMAEALRQFWDYRAVTEWYPYLDTILGKVVKDRSRDLADAASYRFAEETKQIARELRIVKKEG